MENLTKKSLTLLLVFITLQGMHAQTKLTLQPQKTEPVKSELVNPVKIAATAQGESSVQWPLVGADETVVYSRYVSDTGHKPVRQALPQMSPYGPDDDTDYTYVGFNSAAGLADDGTTQTGGMVTFNLQPFACDTVSSDSGLSPYSYISKGKLYSFIPVQDVATGLYTAYSDGV